MEDLVQVLTKFHRDIVVLDMERIAGGRPDAWTPITRFWRDISPTLLRKIAQDIGLTAEQLLGRP